MENTNLIRKIAWSFAKTSHVEYAELFAEASLAYCEAEVKYNPAKGTSFSTFAFLYIRTKLIEYIRQEKKQKHLSTDVENVYAFLSENLKTNTPEFETTNFSKDIKEVIQVILQAPTDFVNLKPRMARGKLRKTLFALGWGQKKISEVFGETKKVIDHLEYGSIILT